MVVALPTATAIEIELQRKRASAMAACAASMAVSAKIARPRLVWRTVLAEVEQRPQTVASATSQFAGNLSLSFAASSVPSVPARIAARARVKPRAQGIQGLRATVDIGQLPTVRVMN